MVPLNDGLHGRRLSEKGVKLISRDWVGLCPVGEALGAKTLCVSQRKHSSCQCFVSMTCQWTCEGL